MWKPANASAAAKVPLVLGTGSADTQTMVATTMPGERAKGNCRARYDQAVSAAAANPALKTFDWWNYTNAGHRWEYTSSGPNDAARVDRRADLETYVTSL